MFNSGGLLHIFRYDEWWEGDHMLSSVQDEKQRIEDLGGCITFMGCWRVNGTYAVSRAIGKSDTIDKRRVPFCGFPVFILGLIVNYHLLTFIRERTRPC